MRLKLDEHGLEWICHDYRCGRVGDSKKNGNKESGKVCIESEVRNDKMEVEITKEDDNQLLRRKEVFFKLQHEGASPSREEARNTLIKALKCSPNLLVIDKMGTEFGKRETVGYAKVYESEDRLKEIEREHIIKRNFGGSEEGKGE
jgi:small subunit ribosomal protein S24e